MKLIHILPIILFLNLTAFSQTLVLNKNGDTTICFSISQGKFLAKEHHRAEEFKILDSLCRMEVKNKDLQINMYIKMQEKMESVVNNQKKIIGLRDGEILSLTESINNHVAEAKKQKRQKVISVIGGAILSGYLGYKYITK